MRRFRATIGVVGNLDKLADALLEGNEAGTLPNLTAFHVEVRWERPVSLPLPLQFNTSSPHTDISAVSGLADEL